MRRLRLLLLLLASIAAAALANAQAAPSSSAPAPATQHPPNELGESNGPGAISFEHWFGEWMRNGLIVRCDFPAA